MGRTITFSTKAVLWRAIAAVSAALMLSAGIVAMSPAQPAQALQGSQFNAGLIITDANFYNSDAMTEAQIQAFLDSKVRTCSNSLCLRVLRTNTQDREAYKSDSSGKIECLAYEGADGELAARIIYKVQQACGISAKVILVTLQKEQGLITNAGPSSARVNRAMGYGCPDHNGGQCAELYSGFFKQIYGAARQFKIYRAAPGFFGIKAKQSQNILYNPNTECGKKWVWVANDATAALYNYTPYTPNASALNNLRGSGDACGSYGNRNFWVYYNDWFGNPTDVYPAASGVKASRIGGTDRYDTAVRISVAGHPKTAETVYVTTGLDFPDALSAAPAAAAQGAPLLLTRPTYLPPAVISEIQRLKPAKIVVVGGPGSVSDVVYGQLATLAPAIRRDGGKDRYASSRALALSAFADGSELAYVATGAGYADALSAGAAAGSQKAPVILVNGVSPTLDADTQAVLTTLGVKRVIIAGGTAVVSSGMEKALRAVSGVTEVTRAGGADRYVVSGVINRGAFTEPVDSVYVASGSQYPDALAGAALAGAKQSPLYLVPSNCMYSAMLQEVVDYHATKMIILGGTGVLGTGIAKFTNCH